MQLLPINQHIDNLEIICKLLNSVAKKFDCKIEYDPDRYAIRFFGDEAYQAYIVEETLSFFGPSDEVRLN